MPGWNYEALRAAMHQTPKGSFDQPGDAERIV